MEITSSKNNRFILHDSQGFEHGDLINLETVKDFISKRNAMPRLQDKIHAVWLCIQVPYVGGRLLEKGDEDFFMAEFGLPVVVVFTKYDMLRLKAKQKLKKSPDFKKWSSDEVAGQVETAALKTYETLCMEPLKRVTLGREVPAAYVSIYDGKSLENLVMLTSKHVQQRLGLSDMGLGRPTNLKNEPTHAQADAVWLAWAVAQRASADLNVEASIAIGKARYWRALGCSFQFSDKSLQSCLDLVHKDIVDAWNFRDPGRLYQEEFKKEVRLIVRDLADDDSGPQPNMALSCGVGMVSTVAGITGALSGPAAPIVIPIAASVALGFYLYTVYNQTPPVLRVLIGYIINLTSVLEGLFNSLQSEAYARGRLQPPLLSQAFIKQTLDIYTAFKASEDGYRCHSEIRHYVGSTPNIFSPRHRSDVTQELVRLMQAYRFRVVQGWVDMAEDGPSNLTGKSIL